MATRAGVAQLPQARRSTSAPRPNYALRHRLLFVVALLTFGFAVLYFSLGLLIRAYPALFPGENAPFHQVLTGLPGSIAPEKPDEKSQFNKRINLLIAGLDKRPGDRFEDAYRTDTIMVATIDPITKQANLLSFPRDLLIRLDLPGGGWDSRINSSYAEGFKRGGTVAAGAEQLAHDIEFNFGITIDHWMVMDFGGVENLIDAVGGVDVDIPPELAVYNWRYSDEGSRPIEWLTFEPGPHHLNGYYAVAFGRNRQDNDLNRVKRQQLVVQAAVEKVFSLQLLNDPISLYNAYKDTVRHDVSVGEMPGLANLLRGSRGNITTYSLGDPVDGIDTVYPTITSTGAAVLTYNPENVTFWLNKAFPKAAYSGANVEIQNAYGDSSVNRAEALGRYLRYAKGVPTVYLGPTREAEPETRVVLFRSGRAELAEDIATWMGIPLAEIESREPPDDSAPDVLIVIGADFVLPDS